jgi:hypothetical protein
VKERENLNQEYWRGRRRIGEGEEELEREKKNWRGRRRMREGDLKIK